MFANAALGKLAAQQPDVAVACRSYAVVVDKVVDRAGKHEARYAEARAYLRRHAGPKRP